MKMWRAASLVEHPGHSDQKVHGRRTTFHSAEISNKGKKVTFNRVTSDNSFKSKTYKNITPASGRRFEAVTRKGLAAKKLNWSYSYGKNPKNKTFRFTRTGG